MNEIRWDFYRRVAQHEHAKKWVELLVKLQKAAKTVDAYARGLDDLLAFFERTSLPLVEATRGEIASYLNDLHSRGRLNGNSPHSSPGLSHNTIQQRLTVARLWYDYLIDTKIRTDDRNPVGRGTYTPHSVLNAIREPGLLRHQIQEPWIPGDDEWDAFLDVVLREEPLRNQAMVFLAYDGALRRSELVGLNVSDIDWPQQAVTIRAEIAKNGLRRAVFYGEATQELLRVYMHHRRRILSEHGGAAAGPLFISESHRNPFPKICGTRLLRESESVPASLLSKPIPFAISA
jgi:site-specific recombinase XerD